MYRKRLFSYPLRARPFLPWLGSQQFLASAFLSCEDSFQPTRMFTSQDRQGHSSKFILCKRRNLPRGSVKRSGFLYRPLNRPLTQTPQPSTPPALSTSNRRPFFSRGFLSSSFGGKTKKVTPGTKIIPVTEEHQSDALSVFDGD